MLVLVMPMKKRSQLGSDHTVQAVLPQLSEQRVDIKVFRDLDFGA